MGRTRRSQPSGTRCLVDDDLAAAAHALLADIEAEIVVHADPAAAIGRGNHVSRATVIGALRGGRADQRAGGEADANATPVGRLGFAAGGSDGGGQRQRGKRENGDLGFREMTRSIRYR